MRQCVCSPGSYNIDTSPEANKAKSGKSSVASKYNFKTECATCNEVFPGCERCLNSEAYMINSKEFNLRDSTNKLYVKCDQCEQGTYYDSTLIGCNKC